MAEEWRDIPGYGNHYMASSLGRIWSKPRVVTKRKGATGKLAVQYYEGRMLKPQSNGKWGHKNIHISVNKVKITLSVHRLVLLAFVGPCPEGMEACHNNGKAHDNRIKNLRWDTHANNNKDRLLHGTYPTSEAHPCAKLTWEAVRAIRADTGTLKEIARKHDISFGHVSRIKGNWLWKESAPA